MLPTRQKALAGLNYSPVAPEPAPKDDKIRCKMWKMDEGVYSKVRVEYRGERIDLVVDKNAPSTDPEKLTDAAIKFFTYFNLDATRILKRAQANDKPTKGEYVERRGRGRKRNYGYSGVVEDSELLGHYDALPIYKDRVMAIFVYIRDHLEKESVEDFYFNTATVSDEVFYPIYKGLSPVTVRKKAGATLGLMAEKGWIAQQGVSNKPRVYKFVMNPFEAEMPAPPAKAEFDRELAAEQMTRDLEAMRRSNDGIKC